MARRLMRKEVTSTTVKMAKMSFEGGLPQAVQLKDEVILGNVSLESAQRQVSKKHGKEVTVFEVIPNTHVYEMEVEEFIKVATLVTEEKEEVLV